MSIQIPPEESATVTTLVHSGVGTGCANCGAPMASDQRYCVTCGARRGQPRFGADSLIGSAGSSPAPPSGPPSHATGRWGAAPTLLAGVGTLLLAMGVGVLIGHNGSGPTRAAAPQVVTLGGSGSASSASNASQDKQPTKTASKKAKTTVVHVTPKVSKEAVKAAAKVLGASGPKNPTVKPGDSCTSGTAGCKNGKFTGDFFGDK